MSIPLNIPARAISDVALIPRSTAAVSRQTLQELIDATAYKTQDQSQEATELVKSEGAASCTRDDPMVRQP